MRNWKIVVLAGLLFVATVAASRAESVLQTVLAAPSLRVDDQILDRAALSAVYESRSFDPLWLERGAAGARAGLIAKVLEESSQHGLNPADYHAAAIKARLGRTDGAELTVLDLLLTDGLMRYASDVRAGRVSPRQVPGERYTKPQVVDAVAAVLATAAAPDLNAALEGLPPQSQVYKGLVVALAKLRGMSDWPVIADGRKLEPGDTSARVAALRKRLAASGELGEAALEGNQFDPKLVEAVKAYQVRHGLDADGVVGRGTLAMLNIPLQTRINQVIANMERLRWQADDMGERYVLVNIPAYQLVAVAEGQVVLNMKVIVGRPARPTPIFSDFIRFVEFNPDWSVPPTIAREDIQPHLIENPLYALEHKNVRMYQDGVEIDPTTIDWTVTNVREFRLRAPPGPRNPLGTVKFLFPNRFDVYLHDTSEPHLFAKTERDFSSGCVRVSDPVGLTNWLLADKPDWSDAKRLALLDSGHQRRLDMQTPVPVYLTYVTAWLGEDGLPAFRNDLYSHDPDLMAALAKAAEAPRRLVVSMTRANPAQPVVDPADGPNGAPQAAP